MFNRDSIRELSVLFVLAVSAVSVARAEDASEGEKLFALHIKSLFAEKCNACHGANADEVASGLNMLSREAIVKGGESWAEEVLVPGKGEESFLYLATTRSEEGFEMPPKEAERLTQEQQWWIRDWINEGAPWPDDARVDEIRAKYGAGEVVKTSGGLSDTWTNRRYEKKHLWAYRPLNVVPVPESANPVDYFVNRALAEAGLNPAPEAIPDELLRRLSFGLTGLPPTQEERHRFQTLAKDGVENAVRKFASHYLDSRHYGEHFGRHWLDVARYADSAGFANDYSRPNAWRYRDYVIRAFNDDKPYDEFIRQQIAGDEIDATDPENVIATGFLRMGPWEQTGMSVFRITRQQWLDDVTDSIGQTFLAHALQCCKCHDHKFDPLPTRDYYSMMAVFTTTQFDERDLPFLKEENKTGFVNAHEWTTAKVNAYRQAQKALNKRIQQERKQETTDAKVGDNGLDPGDEASLARMSKNIQRHSWELDKTRPIAFAVHTGNTIERKAVQKRMLKPADPWKMGAMEPDTILLGGDAFTRGDKVGPAPLSAAVNLGGMQPPAFPDERGKRRLALADWIVDPTNPLTARVIVNRVWTWHFGKGLAGNPNNFGATGSLPSHPELLDYLADWFMGHGWSIKALTELIVSSQTYQRSTHHPQPDLLEETDAARNLYAVFQPRRLTAEELRDAMLAVSGELNRQYGGIPCRPDINIEVAMQPRQIMGGTASVYEPDPLPKQRNRRSVYAEKVRGLRDPFFETFNQPGPDKSCELRETSTVAPQALTLMNAQETQDRALAFAARLMRIDEDRSATIRRAFAASFGRVATAKEIRACLEHWKAATQDEVGRRYSPPQIRSEIVRTVMAEKTGEPYNFVEAMPAYETYVPDLAPHQVDAVTRGLAQVCLVLFNSNEFAYVD